MECWWGGVMEGWEGYGGQDGVWDYSVGLRRMVALWRIEWGVWVGLGVVTVDEWLGGVMDGWVWLWHFFFF